MKELTYASFIEWAENFSKTHKRDIDELLDKFYLSPTDDGWMDYDCTPINVSVFAATGMDGVHFGFLEANLKTEPVVLIAPDISSHMIVGESFREFLSLGCVSGFGLIVELAHRPREIVQELQQSTENPMSQSRLQEELESLRSQFGLQPWKNVGQRLFELQEQYLDELDLPGS